MTLRQKLLRTFYPVLMGLTKLTGKHTVILKNQYAALPPASFYDLSLPLADQNISLSQYQGKKILLVNTASDCGYTAQYTELQQLYDRFQQSLVIIAFPSNDFKEQEKASDAEIAAFCLTHYNINFPIAAKSQVVKGRNQNPIYRWLTDKEQNGWNTKQPSWNFSKYLINEDGILTHYFDPSVSPLAEDVVKAIQS